MNLCIINQKCLEKDEKFIQKFEQQIKGTIDEYNLISPKDKIVVAVSGGKDSTVLLYVLKKLGYKIEAMTVDVHIGCYTKDNLENIRRFCKVLDVKLHESSFREAYGYSVCYMTSLLKQKKQTLGSCTVCGVLRRKVLNNVANKLKASKIATGHNMDDEAQTILMNVIKNNMHMNARMGPKQKLNHDELVQRIKPLYFMSEADITKYSKMNNFPVKYGHCPCSLTSTRNKIKTHLQEHEKKNIMKWFKRVLPFLQKKYASVREIKKCKKCSEPSTGDICRACNILSQIA